MSCIATVKIIGATSLGLLTASLTYQSIETIPLLINELSKPFNPLTNSSVISNYLNQVKAIISNSRFLNLIFAGLSTTFFTLAFKYSPPSGKHPYLLYAALGAPLTIGGVYYQAYSYEEKILKLDHKQTDSIKKSKKSTPKKSSTVTPSVKIEPLKPLEIPSIATGPVVAAIEEQDDLGKSYIHVSEESSSASSITSTPNASIPGSPQIAHQDEIDQSESAVVVEPIVEEEEVEQEQEEQLDLSIEEEIESTLTKKEFVKDLQEIKSSYIIGTTISGFSFFIAVIGLVGDYYLL
ncbi:Chromodomain-helicase DNA-binding protein [Scheffersomyces coipomensis]|uniref:Chromodomain-helicase DNA-binding protein n=1 Tax=Scheffersomyces coipomensis TaxID=1788519 RepID=UPI00315DAE20